MDLRGFVLLFAFGLQSTTVKAIYNVYTLCCPPKKKSPPPLHKTIPSVLFWFRFVSSCPVCVIVSISLTLSIINCHSLPFDIWNDVYLILCLYWSFSRSFHCRPLNWDKLGPSIWPRKGRRRGRGRGRGRNQFIGCQ